MGFQNDGRLRGCGPLARGAGDGHGGAAAQERRRAKRDSDDRNAEPLQLAG
jgi:hypothetical protein